MIIIRSAMLHAKFPLNSGSMIGTIMSRGFVREFWDSWNFFIFLEWSMEYWNFGKILECNVEIYRWISNIGKFWDTRIRYDDAGVVRYWNYYFFKIMRKKKRNCISLEGYKIRKMLKLWNLSSSSISRMSDIKNYLELARSIDISIIEFYWNYMETLH